MAHVCPRFAPILLASILLGLTAPSAHAAQFVFGNEATLAWSPASGDVLLYAVYVARDGGGFPNTPERYTVDTRSTFLGLPGEQIQIQVAAVGVTGEGPRSAASDPIVFAASTATSVGGDPRFHTGQLGGDAREDLLWFSDPENQLTLWIQNADGTHTPQSTAGWAAAGFELAATGDFDGNGFIDLLWRNASGTNLIELRSSWSGEFILGLTDALDPAYEVAATGDVDGNGRSEIIWRNRQLGNYTVWRMNRFAVEGESALPGYPGNWRIAASYDEEGDGRDDLLWRDPTTGLNVLWRMSNVSAWSEQPMPHEPPRYRVAATGDLNGDGDGEVLWEDRDSEDRVLWMGVSGTRLALTDGLGSGWITAGAADLDGNGRRELLMQHRASGLLVSAHVSSATVTAAPFVGFAPSPLAIRLGP